MTTFSTRLGWCVLAWTYCVALLALPSYAAPVRVEAFSDGDWGVAKVTVPMPAGTVEMLRQDDRVTIVEGADRVLYPVQASAPVRRLLRDLLSIELPSDLQFYFLFRGTDALDLTLYAPEGQAFTVRPRVDPNRSRRLMREWWREYRRMYERVHREAESPIVVQNYLTATWARRLGEEMPEPPAFLFRQRQTGGTLFAQLLADEAYRASVERDLVLGAYGPRDTDSLPLPQAASGPPLDLPPLPAEVVIEPIAMHVPQECFYLHYGSFTNYLWFRDFLKRWRGELGNMIVLRSINRDVGPRIEEQIGLRESRLARVLGPAVIQDVAIVGLDPYFRDGAAFGILFHARNNLLLSNDFNGQRRDALARHEGASEETLQIAGHDVSFISSPEGRLRSYYAVDGDFHLVTNSRHLVERFYEAGQGQEALAGLAEFQVARTKMPLERDDTVFIYLSAAMLENLASPHYRIELNRRLRSVGEMNILEMARWAARAEGVQADSIDDLTAAGLLPLGFGRRTDGSQLIEQDGQWVDTRRGHPGRFTPIADMAVEQISRAELARYREFQRTLQNEAGRVVSIAAAIRNDPIVGSELDRITAEVRLAPYSQTRIAQWADRLGPPSAARVAPIDGDVASGQMVMLPLGQPMHLFAGLRDFVTPMIIREGAAVPQAPYDQFVRGYVGAWPRPHILDRIFGRPVGPLDADGVGRLGGLWNLWFRRADDFFLFSFKRDVLLEVGPQLAMVPAERPAQIWLDVDDLADKQVATAVTGLGYMQARATSASGSRFMNSLATQLHVPRERCLEVAESLVAGKFICPLGGEYELIEVLGGFPAWVSTAMPPANRFMLTEIPLDYELPLLEWFRGLSTEVVRDNNELKLRAVVNMVPQPPEAAGQEAAAQEEDAATGNGWRLPGLNLLDSLRGGSAQPETGSPDLSEPAEQPDPQEAEELPGPELLPAPSGNE